MSRTEKLKNITTKIGSGATPSGGQNSYVNGGYSLIRSQNVLDFKFSTEGLAFIDDKQAKALNNVTVEENDILLNITGDSIARCCLVPKEILPARVNQHVSIIRCKEGIDCLYVLYYLQYLKSYLLKICRVGGTRNALTKEAIEKIEIVLQDNHKKRGQLLSLLDAKIELNNRINAELEAMAKTLYDYWFVQFDFPDERGNPYKASGGKMVWNEELKREIPDGWEMRNLGDVLSLEYGKPLKEEDRSGIGYPVVGSNGIVGYHKEYLVEGCGIVVGRKGTAGAVVWVEDNFYPIDTTFYVKDKLGINKLFFHYLLLLRNNFQNLESSSAVPGLNRNLVYLVKTTLPKKNIIQDFHKILEPIFSKMKICNAENQQLAKLRDWLLPMLMNGQVTVQ